jgi:autotransporter-associated beta strand protein
VTIAGPVVVGNFNTSNAITQINTNGGNISIPGAVSAYSGTGRDYMALVYANLYDAEAGAVTGSSTDIYLRFNPGNQFFNSVPGMAASYSIQYLVVAGGGGGGASWAGAYSGGGGGGGGVANGTYSFTGSPLAISVGAGGDVSSSGNDSYLETIKSGGGGGGGNWNTTLGLVGRGGTGYTAGGGGGGAGSNTGAGQSGGTGTQRNGGSGAWSGSLTNFGGSGGGAVGNGANFNSGGFGYSSSITGVAISYGEGAACQGTPVANTGGGGGAQGYGTYTGADGAVILRFALPNASALNAASLSTAFHLNAIAGSVTLSSTVANLSNLEITAGAASTITGPVTGTGSLLKTGSGTLTLSGDNRYSGGTTVTTGTLVLNDTAPMDGLGVIVGTLNINQNGTVQLTGLASALGYNANRVTTININGGVLEAASGQQHIWNLTGGLNFNGGGTLRTNGGTSAAAATSYFEWGVTNITITNPTSPAEIAGRINLRNDLGTSVFTVADGAAENDLLISAAITEANGSSLTKTGAGKLTFTGSNSYSGTTTISAGILQIGNGGTSGTISAAGVTNNAALVFNRSNDFTISNAISGTGTVNKTGAGILTLSGGNSYSGLTTISQSILKCGSNTALGTIAGSTTIVDGAALDLNGINYSTAEPLTINGTGVSASGVLYNSTTTIATFAGPITLASNVTINGKDADLTLSGTINGAYALEIISTNKAFSQTGIVGATSAPVSYTINTGSGLITKGAAATVAGPITLDGGQISLSSTTTSTLTNAAITARSKSYINNASASTITTQVGNVLLSANVDDATDGDATTNGYILFGSGLTVATNGGNITLGGGDAIASGYAVGTSAYPYEGLRVDGTLNINSGGGNITMRGKSYLANTGSAAWGLGFWNLSTGTINSGVGTILLDGLSQSYGGTYNSGLFNNGALTLTSSNTTSDAIKFIGKSTGINGESWGIEAESNLSLIATGDGGGITMSSSQQNTASNLDIVLRGETNILAKSGPINLLGGQSGGISGGTMWIGTTMNIGSKAISEVTSSSSNIVMQYDQHSFSAYPNVATSGSVTWKPYSASFVAAVNTVWFNWNQNSQNMSSLTIGKSGSTADVTFGSALTTQCPVSVYGGTIAFNAALNLNSNSLNLETSTAVTQTAAISVGSLGITGAGTVTLNNTSNTIETIAAGTTSSRVGSLSLTDASGGITVDSVGSATGINTNAGVVLVETLSGNINLNQSISTNNTTTSAIILNAGKSSAIGSGSSGDIIVNGTPTITMSTGGIAKLYSGVEINSTGLTTLAGGASNVRYNYDETTTTFSPVLAVNNKYAIYRTVTGVGDLTIVSSGGDALNSTWAYSNGTISTKTTPVNINASVLENYLSSGPLTIESGNITFNASVTNTAANALTCNGNTSLGNTITATVNSAITNGGNIVFNTGDFAVNSSITGTASASITVNATGGVSTAGTTRRTIGTLGGNITINADSDANGSGQMNLDYLTFNPSSGNTIIRGETISWDIAADNQKPYINGTGSFTFESSDAAFGQAVYSYWFVIDQDSNGISAYTFGKVGNTVNVYINSTFTIAGPINVYGGYVEFTGNITSSANGDIFVKSIINGNNPSVYIGAVTINKSAGTGTLTFQSSGRVLNYGTISATGTGRLNVVMWSDYDNSNNDGGISHMGTISTNGGHVWMGGSNSTSGSYTWNDLTVGDGPSIGSGGYNANAMDIWGNITTNGGDFFAWAGTGVSGGTNGIASNSNYIINTGVGNITFIASAIANTFQFTTTGQISLAPNGGSYASALTFGGTLTSGNFTFNTSHYNGLVINNMSSVGGLTVGQYSGLLNSGTAVNLGNTSNITFNSAATIAGPISIYGGTIEVNENLNTAAGTTLGDILIKASGDISLASAKSITTSGGDVILWSDSDANGGFILLNDNVTINSINGSTNSNLSGGGKIILAGGADDGSNGGIALDGIPDGSAKSSISNGIKIGSTTANFSQFYSGGGDILIRGLSTNNNVTNVNNIGVYQFGKFTANSGTGAIAITGQSTNFYGLNFVEPISNVTTGATHLSLISHKASGTAISINGSSSATHGVVFNYNNPKEILATGGGAIVITGSGAGSGNGIFLQNQDVLATSGAITLIGGAKGIYTANAGMNLGLKVGSTIASSSSDISLISDSFSFVNTSNINTSGKVTLESNADSFLNTLTFPISNLTLSTNVSGLTVGKTTNTSAITFGTATSIAGPITAYGGIITLDANLTTTNNGAISLYTDNALGGLTSTARVITAAGSFNYIPRSDFFSVPVTYPITNLNLTSSGLLIGKPTNTAAITFGNATTIAGPITAYGGTITLDANLTTTNNGNISLYSDNPLGLSASRTINAAGAFKYIPRVTTFTADVTYPIANLTATSTGLTIGNTTNDKNITISQEVIGGAGIELYGNNLNINANLKTTLGGAMYLKGNTTIAAEKYIESNGNFTHDGNLTFKSTATGTAAFGSLGGNFYTVSGTTTVERYIPAKRGWRLLTAPLKGSSNNSIFYNWQNNGAAGDNSTGMVLWDPQGTATPTSSNNGLFQGPQANIYSYATGWQGVSNTNTTNLFETNNTNAFLVFTTGPHAANTISNSAAPSVTTLKPKGTLITGNVPHSLIANQYKLIANPYASPINTETLIQANSGAKAWLLDPTIGTYGGYVAYDGTNWSLTPSVASDKYIQSGQGFFVRNASNATFTISESNKIIGNSNTWFNRTATDDLATDKIRVLLYKQDNAEWLLADGILAVNSSNGNTAVDDTDTNKITNFNENIMFRNGATNLAIEYSALPLVGYVQPMRLTATTVQPYQLRLFTENYTNTAAIPFLEDTVAGTFTPIPTDGSVLTMPFTGIAATSTVPDQRFRIVYQEEALNNESFTPLWATVYPNPVKDGFVNVHLNAIEATANFSITNLVGQLVYKGKLESIQNTIALPQLPEGVYLLSILQDGKRFTTKLYIN